jgi:hypothetical protein
MKHWVELLVGETWRADHGGAGELAAALARLALDEHGDDLPTEWLVTTVRRALPLLCERAVEVHAPILLRRHALRLLGSGPGGASESDDRPLDLWKDAPARVRHDVRDIAEFGREWEGGLRAEVLDPPLGLTDAEAELLVASWPLLRLALVLTDVERPWLSETDAWGFFEAVRAGALLDVPSGYTEIDWRTLRGLSDGAGRDAELAGHALTCRRVRESVESLAEAGALRGEEVALWLRLARHERKALATGRPPDGRGRGGRRRGGAHGRG